jgi:MFS family permease
MGSIWISCDSIILIAITIYYKFLSKNWKPVFIFALVLNIIVLAIVVLVLPESPKWLFNKKKLGEFKKAITKMAKFNGKILAYN